MNYYREAAAALRQNSRTVLLFVAVGAVLGALDSVIHLFVLKPATDVPERMLGLGLIGWQIVYVALTSAANAVFFARIGRETDKPMWRVADDREAMTLFFRLWFLLGLLLLVYVHGLGALLPAQADLATAIVFLASAFTFATLLNVFGACVMFYGKLGRQEVRETFATIGQHAGAVIAICLVGVLAGIVLRDLSLSLAGPEAQLSRSLVAVAVAGGVGGLDALLGCFIFAYSWLVCIFHRDHFEERGDDFDF